MSKPKSRRIWNLLGLLIVGLLAFSIYALTPLTVPQTSRIQIKHKALYKQALGPNKPNELPIALEALLVAEGQTPEYLIAAGWGRWGSVRAYGYALKVVYASGKTVIIDPVNDRETFFRELPTAKAFHDKAYIRMQKALRRADAIVATHEHFDHCTGISQSPHFKEIAPHVHLTKEQLESSWEMNRSMFTAKQIAQLKPLVYSKTHRLRPGIVLIKAPGHTAGSQMIYIRLRSNKEYLLVGDIAWNSSSLNLLKGKPRFVHWLMGEDGIALAHQLRAIHTFRKQNPAVEIIVAHDKSTLPSWSSKP